MKNNRHQVPTDILPPRQFHPPSPSTWTPSIASWFLELPLTSCSPWTISTLSLPASKTSLISQDPWVTTPQVGAQGHPQCGSNPPSKHVLEVRSTYNTYCVLPLEFLYVILKLQSLSQVLCPSKKIPLPHSHRFQLSFLWTFNADTFCFTFELVLYMPAPGRTATSSSFFLVVLGQPNTEPSYGHPSVLTLE